MTKKEIQHIGELLPDDDNAREHNARNLGMIADSLREVGAARSIVIDEDGRVLAGNATVEAAAIAGIENVVVVDGDGETIVAVRRSGLTEEQKKRLALYDNRSAELATWDVGQLAAEKEDGLDFQGLWSEVELMELGLSAMDFSDFDTELEALEGLDEIDIVISVPRVHEGAVIDWLANGERKTAPGMGLGVLRRCGLDIIKIDKESHEAQGI